MTIQNRVQQIVNGEVSMEGDSIEKLIAMAYFIGREEATKSVSDKYAKILAMQKERANKCIYHKMAMKVQGNIDYIYCSDYSQMMSKTFGNDETKF